MMTGAEFLAKIIASGEIFGVRIGDSVGSFDSRLELPFMEELHGRQRSRLLRRDYGLFEATFTGEPAWRCSSIIVEVHRLASTEDLASEISKAERLELPSYIPWADVREALDVSDKLMPVQQSGRDGDYEVFCVPESAVTVHVMADSESRRSEFPGCGDVWSISLSHLA